MTFQIHGSRYGGGGGAGGGVKFQEKKRTTASWVSISTKQTTLITNFTLFLRFDSISASLRQKSGGKSRIGRANCKNRFTGIEIFISAVAEFESEVNSSLEALGRPTETPNAQLF